MKKKSKVAAGIIVIVCAITGSLFIFIKHSNNVKAEISRNLGLIEESRKELPLEVVISSNPFDYVDEECYNNIVAMGTAAIKPLQELMDSGELSAQCEYVCCALLEEVTQCHMDNGKEYGWTNVEEFKSLWEPTIKNLTETLESIQNNEEMSVEEKQAELEKYGVFGKAFAKKAAESDFEMGGMEINITKDKDVEDMYNKIGSDISDRDVKNIIEYLDYKCK